MVRRRQSRRAPHATRKPPGVVSWVWLASLARPRAPLAPRADEGAREARGSGRVAGGPEAPAGGAALRSPTILVVTPA